MPGLVRDICQTHDIGSVPIIELAVRAQAHHVRLRMACAVIGDWLGYRADPFASRRKRAPARAHAHLALAQARNLHSEKRFFTARHRKQGAGPADGALLSFWT
jgi:hypothetical protein